jgi:hypothetical protein
MTYVSIFATLAEASLAYREFYRRAAMSNC